MKNLLLNSFRKVILLIIIVVFLTKIPLYLRKDSPFLLQTPEIDFNGLGIEHRCNIFDGTWVRNHNGPYYTNTTECEIDDRQNCMKFGRPETKYLKWRWKPDDCELPMFDGAEFLEIVRGKSMAFVGDSLGRNQMQSLMCLLAPVARPVDVSYEQNTKFRRFLYPRHNFTLAIFWTTHLVRAKDADPNGFSFMNLHLDEVDHAWSTKIGSFDYLIVSVGPWFAMPMVYYEKGKIVGCHICNNKNITSLSNSYGYKKAFRAAFRTISSLQDYKGTTFLRTISPDHYENGEWNSGGSCVRKRPSRKGEKKVDGYVLELYLGQVEEFWAAAAAAAAEGEGEGEGRKKGLRFRLLDITGVMVMRPDGHPGLSGHGPDEKVRVTDCVHWCLPGAIDTWNEFLLHMLRTEGVK